jgi:hypothetical protein
MRSLSQFTSALLGEPDPEARNGTRPLTVCGPLEGVNDPEDYTPPFLIHSTIIQSPDDDHDPDKPARGVGVAILPRKQGYTSEVLTWCDHLPKLDGTEKQSPTQS